MELTPEDEVTEEQSESSSEEASESVSTTSPDKLAPPPPVSEGTTPETGTPRLDVLDIDGVLPSDEEQKCLIILQFRDMWNKRAEERMIFRKSNLDVNRKEFEVLVKSKKLEANLKKCTAFVRKLKQFVETQKVSLQSDLNSLNLTKYQSEMAAVFTESKFKPSEIPAILHGCAMIHQRYSEFSDHLFEAIKKTLPSRKTEVSQSNIGRIASDVRFFTELLLGGIIPQQEGYQILVATLKTMIALDKDGSKLIIPFTSLVRGLSDDLFGIIRNDTKSFLISNGNMFSLIIRSDALSSEKKKELRILVQEYFDAVKSNLKKKHEKVLYSEKGNRKMLTTRGEVPVDMLEGHTLLSQKFDKYFVACTKLAVLLDIPMPMLEPLPPDPEDELEKALLMTEDGDVLTEVPGIVLFDNEETRQFYQDYPDLKVYLPPKVYRDTIVEMQEKTQKMEEMEKMVNDFDEALEKSELQEDQDLLEESEATADVEGDLPPSMRPDNEEEKDNSETKEGPSQTQKQAFSGYLDNLPNLVNKNMIDKAAIEFAESFNNKRHRRELVKRLFLVPRQRVDLLPLYSRLVAILSRVFPDIGFDLWSMLKRDFRYLVIKKDQIKIDTKLKITRFIGELVNFSIFPKSEAFNCLRMLLRNFTHHQVEMTCALVETCGRVLYRSSDSHRRMKIYLEEILRKKTVRNLEPRYVYMVDNAHFHICPPPSGTIARKKKPPLHAFLEYVLWEDLQKSTLERATLVLKKFDWTDPEKYLLVIDILSHPWKFNYIQMDAAAALVSAVKKFRPSVAICVVENLTEQIRIGCDYEFDDFNTYRMSTSQYLALIYTYKAVSATTLFNIWYYLISYGVTYRDDAFTKMDPPDCMHRVRMICQMLKVSADYLTSSRSRRRLNFFLKYFQRYYVYKRNLPCWLFADFPHSVEELYEDTLKRVRSRWKFVRTMEDAEQEIAEMDEHIRSRVKDDSIKNKMSNPMCLTVSASKRPKRSKRKLMQGAKQPSLDKISEEPMAEVDPVTNEVKTGIIKDPYDMYDPEEHNDFDTGVVDDSDFLAAFEQMCQEANQMAASRVIKGDIPVPMSAPTSQSNSESSEVGVVKVTLLTKKGNKPKLKTVEVSAQEDFLVNLRSREEAEKLEKQRMKSRTLAITRMQEEEERRENQQTVSQLVFNRSHFGKYS